MIKKITKEDLDIFLRQKESVRSDTYDQAVGLYDHEQVLIAVLYGCIDEYKMSASCIASDERYKEALINSAKKIFHVEEILLYPVRPSKGKLLRSLGKNVRTKRKELKLSQIELATLCGYSQASSSTAIYQLEHGNLNISLERLYSVASALDTTVDELLKIA